MGRIQREREREQQHSNMIGPQYLLRCCRLIPPNYFPCKVAAQQPTEGRQLSKPTANKSNTLGLVMARTQTKRRWFRNVCCEVWRTLSIRSVALSSGLITRSCASGRPSIVFVSLVAGVAGETLASSSFSKERERVYVHEHPLLCMKRKG